MQFLFAIWTFVRGVLTTFWDHWGPVTKMFNRTVLEFAMALVLLAIGLVENLVKVFHGLIYVLDRAIDLLEDILDLLD